MHALHIFWCTFVWMYQEEKEVTKGEYDLPFISDMS